MYAIMACYRTLLAHCAPVPAGAAGKTCRRWLLGTPRTVRAGTTGITDVPRDAAGDVAGDVAAEPVEKRLESGRKGVPRDGGPLSRQWTSGSG